jgi:hypothetical protein
MHPKDLELHDVRVANIESVFLLPPSLTTYLAYRISSPSHA